MDILFFLILGHLAGDYAFQTDRMAAEKGRSLTVLSIHTTVYVITLWFFFLLYSLIYHPGLYIQGATLLFLGALYIQHWGQDFLKSRYKNGSKQMYYLDQVIHLAVLYLSSGYIN